METRQTRRGFIGGLALTGIGIGLGASLAFPGAAGAVALSQVHGTSKQGGLKLRAKPNGGAAVLAILPEQTPLTVRATASDWFKVTALGKTGYLNSNDVLLTGAPSTEINRGNPNRKQAALTFDAGSDRGNALRIIQILKQHKIKGSFGLTGAWVTANPKDAKAIATAAHQPLNHTISHPSFTGVSDGTHGISPARRLSQVIGNEALLAAAGVPMAKPYWRPPYGDIDQSVLQDLGAAGYDKTVMWSVDSMGWAGASVDEIHATVMNAAEPGMIVLMHVGAESQDVDALDRIITDLKDQGYGFGTVAEVIKP
jgi:peptidoglycan/xylan/chitin deacetylase (PgdA/CDA1 family)